MRLVSTFIDSWETKRKVNHNIKKSDISKEYIKLKRKSKSLIYFDVMKAKMIIFSYKIWLFINVKNKNKIILIFLLIFVCFLDLNNSCKVAFFAERSHYCYNDLCCMGCCSAWVEALYSAYL